MKNNTQTTTELKKIHFAPNYFMNPTHPITVTLIGCGGTGSLVLTRLARMDRTLRKLGGVGLYVTAYDGDSVEAKNEGRQNFTTHDIGLNKATCLMEKINLAYNLNWEAIPKYVEKQVVVSNIIITAVDDANFRMDFEKYTQQLKNDTDRKSDYSKPYYWLDLGNGKDFGQAVLGTILKIQQPDSKKYKPCQDLKNIVDIYGELSNYDAKEIQGFDGCSFEDSLEKQDLFINDEIAMKGCTMLWKLFKNLYIDTNAVFVNQETSNTNGSLFTK